MKQIDPNAIESPEQQEQRARQRLRPKPLVSCALIVGVIVLFFGGVPWAQQESMISAMSRLVSKNFVINIIGHFALALIYGWIVAGCIYRFPAGPAIGLGAAIGLGLYGLNYAIFGVALGFSSNELHVGLTHVVFCLFFSAAYKAAAVPRPRWKQSGRPVEV